MVDFPPKSLPEPLPKPLSPIPPHPPGSKPGANPGSKQRVDSFLSRQLHGTRLGCFVQEFLSNSGHFWVLKSLATVAAYGWSAFLSDPADYLLTAAIVLQTAYLSRAHANRFWGNLVGVSIYTLVDWPLDGGSFFADPTHWVLWGFSLVIALLQSARHLPHRWLRTLALPLESIARILMLVGLYAAISIPPDRPPSEWNTFFATPGHYFLLVSLGGVGLLLGLQSLQLQWQQRQLSQTAKTLQSLAQWGMGSHAVAAAMLDPTALAFHRCDRAMIFLDIRGFTQWCETTDPDQVATVLNRYYQQVEPAAAAYQPLRITFTADEVMAIYAQPTDAIAAAIAMQTAACQALDPYGVGAGCAVHYGTVIEGLFGSDDVRTYTAIGDAVNVAKRLEGATPAGEIGVSGAMRDRLQQLGTALPPGYELRPRSPVIAKGKTTPIPIWQLISVTTQLPSKQQPKPAN